MLAFELAMLKAKGIMDAEEGRAHLEARQLLEPDEWAALLPGDRHSMVFWWIQTELVRLARVGKLEREFVATTCTAVSSMRGQANDLMSSLDRDKPYPYASLCGTLVHINLLLMSTSRGVEWAKWLASFGDELPSQPKFWVDIIVLFSWNVSYKALYDLSYVLHNPFGDGRLGVAHETIGAGIAALSTSMAKVGGHLPPAIKAHLAVGKHVTGQL